MGGTATYSLLNVLFAVFVDVFFPFYCANTFDFISNLLAFPLAFSCPHLFPLVLINLPLLPEL